MDFKSLAATRYSQREYNGSEIEQSKLDYILECARLAPSAVNRQPVMFYVIRDAETLKRIKSCYQRSWFDGVSLCIVACGNHAEGWHRPTDGKNHTDIDVAIAVDHLTLAATEVGLGTCWVCNFDAKKCAEILSLPENIEPVALIPVGVSNDTTIKEKNRKKITDIVSYV